MNAPASKRSGFHESEYVIMASRDRTLGQGCGSILAMREAKGNSSAQQSDLDPNHRFGRGVKDG